MKIRLISRFLKILFRNSYRLSPSIMDFTYFGLIDSKTSMDASVGFYKIPDLHKILGIIKGSSAQGERKDLAYAPPYFTDQPGRPLHPSPIWRAATIEREEAGRRGEQV
jgi:hypothetical protein